MCFEHYHGAGTLLEWEQSDDSSWSSQSSGLKWKDLNRNEDIHDEERAKIWGMAKVSLWVVHSYCSMDKEFESHFKKPRKFSLRNSMRLWSLSKLSDLQEAGIEDSVWMFEQEIHDQNCPSKD